MNELRIICCAQYLTTPVEEMRSSDYHATHLVKAVKGLPLHEGAYTRVTIGGRTVKIKDDNKDVALDWFAAWPPLSSIRWDCKKKLLSPYLEAK